MMVFSSAGFAEPKHLRTETWNSVYLLCELSGEEKFTNFTLQHHQEKTLNGTATVVIENRREIFDDPKENFEYRIATIGSRGNPFFSVTNSLSTVEQSSEKEFKFASSEDNGGNDYTYLSINRMTGTLNYSDRNFLNLTSENLLITKEFYGNCEKQTKQKF